jgi:hypothetical protein
LLQNLASSPRNRVSLAGFQVVVTTEEANKGVAFGQASHDLNKINGKATQAILKKNGLLG